MKGFVSFSSSKGFSKPDIATWEDMKNSLLHKRDRQTLYCTRDMRPLYCTSPPPQWKAEESEKEEAFSAHLSLKQGEQMQILFSGEVQSVVETSAVPFSSFLDLTSVLHCPQAVPSSQQGEQDDVYVIFLSRWLDDLRKCIPALTILWALAHRRSEDSLHIWGAIAGWWSLWLWSFAILMPCRWHRPPMLCQGKHCFSCPRHPWEKNQPTVSKSWNIFNKSTVFFF